jgi:hypothetical protein
LQTDTRQDPNCEPNQVENDEETIGLRRQPEQQWKSIRENASQTLPGNADTGAKAAAESPEVPKNMLRRLSVI